MSYPRTDCSYVSSEYAKGIKTVVQGVIAKIPELSKLAMKVGESELKAMVTNKSYVDDSKLGAHTALAFTGKQFDFAKLSTKQQKVALMIAKQTLATFYPAMVVEKTTVVTDSGAEFKTNGKVEDL